MTSTGGFSLRRVFYTVPSRLVGHRLRVRLYDDRLAVYAGTEELMTLPRGHAGPGERRGRVVNYRHVLLSDNGFFMDNWPSARGSVGQSVQ